MPTLEEIYASAASVANQTGVDPAIITAIAQTEYSPNVAGQPTSLGITTGAPSGRGTSGGTAGSAAPEYCQPSRFWSYASGAEASQAFANYIHEVFPAQFPNLGNATAFLQSMKGTNYDVVYNVKGNPASGRNTAAENRYWDEHIAAAQNFLAQFGGVPIASLPSVSTPGRSTDVKESQPSGFTPPSGGPGQPVKLDFGGSAYHVLVSIGLVVLALVLVLGGIWLLTSSKDLSVTIGEAPGSHERGYSRGVVETAHEFGKAQEAA